MPLVVLRLPPLVQKMISYDQSIINGVFNVFLPIKSTHLLYKVSSSSDLNTDNEIKYTNNVDVSNAPCCPMPTALSPKNISAAVVATVIMTSPSPIGFLKFLQSQLLIYPYRSSDLKHTKSFWWLILFFIDEFFIFSLGSAICKKYTNTNGKGRKDTNAIDISII